jgi:hypothetical protein
MKTGKEKLQKNPKSSLHSVVNIVEAGCIETSYDLDKWHVLHGHRFNVGHLMRAYLGRAELKGTDWNGTAPIKYDLTRHNSKRNLTRVI